MRKGVAMMAKARRHRLRRDCAHEVVIICFFYLKKDRINELSLGFARLQLASFISFFEERERGCFRARGRQQKFVLLFLDISRNAIGAVIEIK